MGAPALLPLPLDAWRKVTDSASHAALPAALIHTHNMFFTLMTNTWVLSTVCVEVNNVLEERVFNSNKIVSSRCISLTLTFPVSNSSVHLFTASMSF